MRAFVQSSALIIIMRQIGTFALSIVRTLNDDGTFTNEVKLAGNNIDHEIVIVTLETIAKAKRLELEQMMEKNKFLFGK